MKKVLIYLAIILGVILLFVFGSVVVMMLAPGMEVFGIQYVSRATGVYEKSFNHDFADDIYIYAGDIDVNVGFGSNGVAGVHLVQDFQGFTRSKDLPDVIVKNKDGSAFNRSSDSVAYINVSQYKKFIWASSANEGYVNIILPLSYGTKNVYIETTNSLVTFSGTMQSLNEVTVKTGRTLKIENNITINKLDVSLKEDLTLGNNVTVKSVTANIDNGNLSIANAVSGKIEFTTASGDLTFNSCDNLTVNSSTGNINRPTSGNVNGNLEFNTNSGSVEIGFLLGSNHKISSKSGKIKIDNCTGPLTINTSRAKVELGKINKTTITTTTGDVSISGVTGDLNIETISGDIVCGTVNGNATTKTKTGDTTFTSNITGDLNATSTSGNVAFVYCNSLNANTQEGSVMPYSSTNIVNNLANVTTTSGRVKITSILGVTTDDAYNNISTQYGEIVINNIDGYAKVTSNRGNVNINTASKIYIRSDSGAVNLGTAPQGAEVYAWNNSITIGEQGNVGSLVAESTNGSITVKNTTADVTLSSKYGKVTVHNLSGSKLYIKQSDSVEATGLKGDVDIVTSGNVNVKLAQVDDVNITSKSYASSVVVDATCIAYNKVNYNLYTQKASVHANVYNDDTLITSGSTIENNTNGFPEIYIQTNATAITLMLGDKVA